MNTTQRIVITGGPGTGKSTIIDLLEEKGYTCHREVSREVIKQEMEKGTDHLPWENVSGFSNLVFDGQTSQYRKAQEGTLNFYDRGIVDVIAYLKRDKLPTDAIEPLVQHYKYASKVFVTPPWEDIYSTDNERREDFEAMNEIHNILVDLYKNFGYEVIEVPKGEAEERVNFILGQLGVG